VNQRDKLLAVVADDLEQDCEDYLALRDLMQALYAFLLERDSPEIDRLNLQITTRSCRLSPRSIPRSVASRYRRTPRPSRGARRWQERPGTPRPSTRRAPASACSSTSSCHRCSRQKAI